MIGVLSGTVTAAARQLGHYIALGITALLMVVVWFFIFSAAHSGPRMYLPRWRRWGPTAVFTLAFPLILADPMRHVLGDLGLWGECGNNGVYPRINSTFPAECFWSSSQYRCGTACCVPVWLPTSDAAGTDYAWVPKQSMYFPDSKGAAPGGQFGTLRPDGSLYFPPSFNRSLTPYRVFDGRVPTILFASGDVNHGRGSAKVADCPAGVNAATGYCNLELTDGELCDCDECTPHEDWNHLSPMGLLFTIVFTYLGFALLSIAVMWNAGIVSKLAGMRRKWRALRATRAEPSSRENQRADQLP